MEPVGRELQTLEPARREHETERGRVGDLGTQVHVTEQILGAGISEDVGGGQMAAVSEAASGAGLKLLSVVQLAEVGGAGIARLRATEAHAVQRRVVERDLPGRQVVRSPSRESRIDIEADAGQSVCLVARLARGHIEGQVLCTRQILQQRHVGFEVHLVDRHATAERRTELSREVLAARRAGRRVISREARLPLVVVADLVAPLITGR